MDPSDYVPLPPLQVIFPYMHSKSPELPPSLDPFTITTSSGFMPQSLPLTTLPKPFAIVDQLLDDLPVVKANGQPGLLAKCQFGQLIDNGTLPDLSSEVDNLVASDGQPDMTAVTAVFRDYSFLASSYLLEPCWERWRENPAAGYGLGRQVLPKCIAGPLVKTADILDIPAYMSYAASYALYNYSLVDVAKGPFEYDNIRLIRAFEKGLDPRSSEAGFILTHIHMVAYTSGLVKGAVGLLEAVQLQNTQPTSGNIEQAVNALKEIISAMTVIEECMEKMWANSMPKDYNTYRIFIFGITNQSMFPDGVVYEGQRNDHPQFFRGESGANDSIIPLLDYLCEVPMPSNPLTVILKDFKKYRPQPHRTFLSYVQSKAAELGIHNFCVHGGGLEVAALYFKVLEHIRSFRWRHWLFAREYIIKRSRHPTATGGSPIVTWLPNQLLACMDFQQHVYEDSGLKVEADKGTPEWAWLRALAQNASQQKDKLAKEVAKYCQERGA